MSQNLDITQFVIEKLIMCCECVVKSDEERIKKMKIDLSQFTYLLEQMIFFFVWFFVLDVESKYSEGAFFAELGTWLVFDLYIIFVEIDYIAGEKNDVDFRETCGKTLDIIQNIILLLYFSLAIFKYGQDSSQHIILFAFQVVNMVLNIISIILMAKQDKLKFKRTDVYTEPAECGDIIFLIFVLAGQCFAFIIMLQLYQYVKENDDNFFFEFVFIAGMIGDVVLGFCVIIAFFYASCDHCKKAWTFHRILLLILQGLGFGIFCVYVSIVIGVITIILVISYCKKKSEKTEEKAPVPSEEN